MNDYLNGTCTIENILTEHKIENSSSGKLLIGLANPSIEAIRQIASKDKTWHTKALCQLLSLKSTLTKQMLFDYVFLDISPGLSYSSINAVLSADFLLIVTSLDESDLAGTRRMFELYTRLTKKIAVVMNKVPIEDPFSTNKGWNTARPELSYLPVVGSIPCFCDVLGAAGGCLFPCEKPGHPFTRKLYEISDSLEHLWNADDKVEMLTLEHPSEVLRQ
jgi:MinD-like ATPase involved in chromosome partitioning or flagellar assembly